MKRVITAAEASSENKLDDAIGNLEADFEYIISGLEKLSRSGVNASNDALAIAENISNALKSFTSDIADKISE